MADIKIQDLTANIVVDGEEFLVTTDGSTTEKTTVSDVEEFFKSRLLNGWAEDVNTLAKLQVVIENRATEARLGALVFDARSTENAQKISDAGDGVIGWMNGYPYLVDSDYGSSCTNDISVDNMVPLGIGSPEHFGGDIKAALEFGWPSLCIRKNYEYSGTDQIVTTGPLTLFGDVQARSIIFTGTREGSILKFAFPTSVTDIIFDGNGNQFAATSETGMIETLKDYFADRVTYRNCHGSEDHKQYGVHVFLNSKSKHNNCVFENITTQTNSAASGGFTGGVWIADARDGSTVLKPQSHIFEGCTFEKIYTKKNGSDVLFPDSDGIRNYIFATGETSLAAAKATIIKVVNCQFLNVLKSGVKLQDVTCILEDCSFVVDNFFDQGQTECSFGFRSQHGPSLTARNIRVIGAILRGVQNETEYGLIDGVYFNSPLAESAAILTGDPSRQEDHCTVRNLTVNESGYAIYWNGGDLNVDGVQIGPDFGTNEVDVSNVSQLNTGVIVYFQQARNLTIKNVVCDETAVKLRVLRGRNQTSYVTSTTFENVYLRCDTVSLFESNAIYGYTRNLRLVDFDWDGAADAPVINMIDRAASAGLETMETRNLRLRDSGSTTGRMIYVYGASVQKYWNSKGDKFICANDDRTATVVYGRSGVGSVTMSEAEVISESVDVMKKLVELISDNYTRFCSNYLNDANTLGTVNRVADIYSANRVTVDANDFDCFEAAPYIMGASKFKMISDNTVRSSDTTPFVISGGTSATESNTRVYS